MDSLLLARPDAPTLQCGTASERVHNASLLLSLNPLNTAFSSAYTWPAFSSAYAPVYQRNVPLSASASRPLATTSSPMYFPGQLPQHEYFSNLPAPYFWPYMHNSSNLAGAMTVTSPRLIQICGDVTSPAGVSQLSPVSSTNLLTDDATQVYQDSSLHSKWFLDAAAPSASAVGAYWWLCHLCVRLVPNKPSSAIMAQRCVRKRSTCCSWTVFGKASVHAAHSA